MLGELKQGLGLVMRPLIVAVLVMIHSYECLWGECNFLRTLIKSDIS